MMMPMMGPVLVPALARYRRANSNSHGAHVELETLAIATGYFSVWTVVGLAIFASGVALATLAMHIGALATRVPTFAGAVMLLAGLSQFTSWKVARLRCCYAVLGTCVRWNTRGAWVEGLRFGIHCVICCAPLVAMLAILGIMDVRVMAAITIATTLERTQRFGTQVAHLSGTVAVAMGGSLLIQGVM
jgi:predicted metal-binding membrane protein